MENGSLNNGMPSIANLPEPQRWQTISSLRSVNRKEEYDCQN
jgi:hypothetical protein